MGKGGGCVPSKKKVLISDSQKNHPVSESIGTQSQVPETTTMAVGEVPIQAEGKKLRVFIVYYSMYGHVELLAREIKKGVDSIEGVEGVLYRVAETLPKAVLEMMKAPPKDDNVPVMTAQKLAEADGVIFGFPTRFGSMAAQMKAFFDSTGQLWREQKLAGKPAGFFVSTGTQGGGQETTAWTAIPQLVHHGMIYVPVGYTFGGGMFEMESIRGGTPYGAGVFAGDGTRTATDTELALAEHQGKLMATTVKKLALTS